ncbi:hypothetical protein [Ectopseudomonas toyotomiensis]|uniref:hypothetical protein n=1 Tax=Ectopseudomonas toyotomiensis TaxID=554344 RepID=UPI003D0F990C
MDKKSLSEQGTCSKYIAPAIQQTGLDMHKQVAKIVPYAGAVNVIYLSAWLNSRFFVASIDPGRSNGISHISTSQAASVPYALPPLAEQHRIVAKADQPVALCDQLKTRLTQARQLNEQLASTLVEQAVA